MANHVGICRLCGNRGQLQKSHIIPAGIFRNMNTDGNGLTLIKKDRPPEQKNEVMVNTSACFASIVNEVLLHTMNTASSLSEMKIRKANVSARFLDAVSALAGSIRRYPLPQPVFFFSSVNPDH